MREYKIDRLGARREGTFQVNKLLNDAWDDDTMLGAITNMFDVNPFRVTLERRPNSYLIRDKKGEVVLEARPR